MMEVFSPCVTHDFRRFLYEHDFPDWFVMHVDSGYDFDWDQILPDLRNGRFFFPRFAYFTLPGTNISGQYLSEADVKEIGESMIERLAALACILAGGSSVTNSLELDGFSADVQNLRLVPLEGPVSAQAEEDALTALVNRTGITGGPMIAKHIADANGLYIAAKYHPSLNESRSLLQCLIDNASADTNSSGAHSVGFPGGTSNRIDYLANVGFLTGDEATAFKSAWGALSAGSHPGVPAREEARIGLILALEFGQLLLLKFGSWKAGAYKDFK